MVLEVVEVSKMEFVSQDIIKCKKTCRIFFTCVVYTELILDQLRGLETQEGRQVDFLAGT
jgi:hypothetical protein